MLNEFLGQNASAVANKSKTNPLAVEIEVDQDGNPILTFDYVSKLCQKFYNVSNPIVVDQLPLSHNQVKKIQNLDKFKNVKTVNLSYNKIEKIENIDHMVFLQTLELRYNNIRAIQGLNNMGNLTHLNLQGNSISEI